MSMFCYQCQETAKNQGCTVVGVCGKKEDVANIQDLLIYTIKGISQIVKKGNLDIKELGKLNHEILTSLFMTITNANFDKEAIENQIKKMLVYRDELNHDLGLEGLNDSATFQVSTIEEMEEKANSPEVRILATENVDVRSLRELITYGLKGMAAYGEHALNIGKENYEIYDFIYEALAATLDDSLSADDLVALTLKTGEYGVKAMALLDKANTTKYGNPEITEVNIGVRNNPAILISGHDLVDLEQLLEQTKDTGVDVYTHSEMLPAHYRPFFKKYSNLVGNYGNAWYLQKDEIKKFHGPVLFTTNCLVPPDMDYKEKIFTSGPVGFEGCKYIKDREEGKQKDFSEIINIAKHCQAPEELEKGEIVGGFGHKQVLSLADKIIEAVKSGAIKRFIVMDGCDGRHKSRSYFTEVAENLPKDTVILTAGCAKYKYNKLNLGDINGIPRVLDAGQCNDSYSLAVIALKLKEVFG